MNAPVRAATSLRALDFGDPGEVRRIEGFVAEHGGSLFHRPAWLKGVEAGTGQRAAGLVAERMGTVTGWLPLTEVRSALFGKALVSSGFGVGGGILACSEDAAQALAEGAQSYALRAGFSGVELRGGPVPQGWDSWSDKHCGFERPLAADDEAELLAIPRKARAEVRKGLGFGHRITVGRGPRDIAAHYACYSASVRNLGTPVFPKRLFAAMLAAFPDSSDILTVWAGETALASVLSFYHDGAVLPFWGGGVIEARAARANEVMYYELMLHARRQGMTRFDFGRSTVDAGTFRFKKQWGAEPKQLYWYYWLDEGREMPNLKPDNPKFNLVIRCWQKLPIVLTQWIGPHIVKHLP